MPTYTYDPVAGLARLSAEDAQRLWEGVPDGTHFGTDEAEAVYYVQAPLTAGQADEVLMRFIVHDIRDLAEVPYHYLVWLDGNIDDEQTDEIFVSGQLGLLELLARYAPFLVQPLGEEATRDQAIVLQRLRTKVAA